MDLPVHVYCQSSFGANMAVNTVTSAGHTAVTNEGAWAGNEEELEEALCGGHGDGCTLLSREAAAECWAMLSDSLKATWLEEEWVGRVAGPAEEVAEEEEESDPPVDGEGGEEEPEVEEVAEVEEEVEEEDEESSYFSSGARLASSSSAIPIVAAAVAALSR
jgi:hypothetical protein